MKKRKFWTKDLTVLCIALVIQLLGLPLFNKYVHMDAFVQLIIVLAIEIAELIVLGYFIVKTIKEILKKRVVLNEDESTSLSSEEEMNRSCTNLVNKASTLNEKYAFAKEDISTLTSQIKEFVPVNDIAAIKLEQNIIWKITEVSNACGAALAGKANAQESLKAKLDELKKLISQRQAFQE